jgi:hypothetical protein
MTEILGCGRTVAGDVVAYDIEWEGDLSSYGSVVWAMEVSDGEETIVLGHERSAGAFAGQYVEGQGTGRRETTDEDADVGEDEITVRVPANLVGVAADWPSWVAVILGDGEPLARKVVPTG